jgi:hypothetical protein
MLMINGLFMRHDDKQFASLLSSKLDFKRRDLEKVGGGKS